MTDYPESQLTPWFKGDNPPVRAGNYQLRLAKSKRILDGWFENATWQIRRQGSLRKMTYANDQIQWRGLNREPEPTQIQNATAEFKMVSKWQAEQNLSKIISGMTYSDVTALIGKGGKPDWCQPKEEGQSTYTWADGDRWIKFVTFNAEGIVTKIDRANIG